jgi:hypothetical protein
MRLALIADSYPSARSPECVATGMPRVPSGASASGPLETENPW